MSDLYTFGVYNGDVIRAVEAGELSDDEAPFDELDVRASSQDEAHRLARAEANDLYGEDSVLFTLPPGGSAGLVQISQFDQGTGPDSFDCPEVAPSD